MNTSFLKTTAFSLALIGGASFMNASGNVSLSEMTAAEIISLIPESTAAASNANSRSNTEATMQVSGHDLLTKAYGMIPALNDRKGTIDLSESVINMTPVEEDNNLWLDSSDGYSINYYGMTPDVSALVRLENDSINDYGFFFLFPYSSTDKMSATADQVDFSKTMLQEFEDMGLDLGANPYTSDLFEIAGDYTDNYVAVRLIDDEEGERYILMLSVEPHAICEADNMMAE